MLEVSSSFSMESAHKTIHSLAVVKQGFKKLIIPNYF